MLKLFFLFIILGSILHIKDKDKFLKWTIFVLFAAIAFRNEVCYVDTIRYVYKYRELYNMSLGTILSDVDKDAGFYVVSKLISMLLGSSYTLWFATQGLLYVIPLFLLLRKYSQNYTLSLVVYCALGFAFFSLTGIRQNDAMGFTMLALFFLLEDKKKYFLLFALCSVFFHKTSAIFLIVYFFDKIPMNRKAIFIYLLFSIMVIVSSRSILAELVTFDVDERFEWYLEHQRGLNFSGLIQQVLLFGASYYMLGEERNERSNRVFIMMSILGITFQGMSFAIAEMFRISMYFSIANIFLFANAMNFYCRRTGNKSIITLAIIVISLYFVTSPNNGFLRDYYFFFQTAPVSVYNELYI